MTRRQRGLPARHFVAIDPCFWVSAITMWKVLSDREILKSRFQEGCRKNHRNPNPNILLAHGPFFHEPSHTPDRRDIYCFQSFWQTWRPSPAAFFWHDDQIGQLSQTFVRIRSLSVIESAFMNASQMNLAAYGKYLYAKDHDMSKKSILKCTFG